MANRHTVIPRTMCFVFYKDAFLLYKASEKKDWVGIYDPVGGHIEKGEDIIESANREIFEETGLRVTDTQLKGIVHVTNFYGKNIMMFVTSSTSTTQEVSSSDEGELEWVTLEDVDKIPAHEDVKPIINCLMKLKQGELFTAVSEFSDDGKLKYFNIH